MRTKPPLTLDAENPFVNAVLSATRGQHTFNDAVDLLLAAQRKHDVFVVQESGQSALLSANFSGFRTSESIPTAVDIVRRIPQASTLVPFMMAPAVGREDWIQNVLVPFMDEIPLVVSAENFANEFCFITKGPIFATFSWRDWGSVVATWLNHDLPVAEGERPWEYIDFYMDSYVTPRLSGYKDWAYVLLRVLKEASDRLTREGVQGDQ